MHTKIANNIKTQITVYQQQAHNDGHRLPVAVHADGSLINNLEKEIPLWSPESILISESNTLKANDIIGHEYDLVVFRLHPLFDPNLFAAISGTLRAGGLFICLVPDNQSNGSPFYQYVLNKINDDRSFLCFQIKGAKDEFVFRQPLLSSDLKLLTQKALIQNPFRQQTSAINDIKKVVTGHRKRPLILTADRGRGKSAAIGIAIAELLSQRTMNIVVTAPSLAATSVIFKHIKHDLPGAKFSKGHVRHNTSMVTFIAPDDLLQTLPEIDLLIVDEAAGLNLFSLQSFARHYSRIVFATTLHGYEGSGQGFAIRFTQLLNTISPQWVSVTLDQPVRWKMNDPLEQFIDQVFVLSSPDIYFDTNQTIDINKLDIRLFNNSELCNNKDILRAIFTLLKNAHYKTTPNDLRQLMDSENAVIFATYYNNTLVAAAIAEKEGNLKSDLIDDIYHGNRRPKGELIPQSIIMHLGIKEAGLLSFLRVMRIAVYPELQGKTIGSHLLKSIIKHATQNKFDFVACSFGATTELLKFWFRFDFRTFRIGYKKNNFSGSNAALLVKPLTDKNSSKESDKEPGKETNKITSIANLADIVFFENFIAQLSASLQNLDSLLTVNILNNVFTQTSTIEISSRVINDINSYAKHNRSYDDNLASMKHFLLEIIGNTHLFGTLSDTQAQLIVLKVFQNKDWLKISSALNISGKKQGEMELKSGFAHLLDCYQQS